MITLLDRAFGGMTNRDAGAYIAAQFAGGAVGAMLANLMFDPPAINISTHVRSGSGLWLGEVIATSAWPSWCSVSFGPDAVPPRPSRLALTSPRAYFFTSSRSFANPAVTVARTLSNTFAGIRPSSVPGFVVFQLAGAAIAIEAIRLLYPDASDVAERLIVPHEGNPATSGPSGMSDPPVRFRHIASTSPDPKALRHPVDQDERVGPARVPRRVRDGAGDEGGAPRSPSVLLIPTSGPTSCSWHARSSTGVRHEDHARTPWRRRAWNPPR